MLLGLSVAAPIGPINVEIIRRGLTQSSTAAFAMGCGAVTADCAYLSLAMLGAGWVSAAGESAVWRIIGLGLGGGMLLWLGIGAIRKSVRISDASALDAATGGTASRPPTHLAPLRIYALGVVLTLANPMTIALWLSIAAGFAASGGASESPALRIAGVLCGALSWVCFVTTMTAGARRWINPSMMRAVNIISGCMLILFGFRFLLRILGPAN